MLLKHSIYQDDFAFNCVEKTVEEIAHAKYELARACFYTMMSQGLSWEEIFYPILANITSAEIEEAIELLLETMEKEGMPDLKRQFESDIKGSR